MGDTAGDTVASVEGLVVGGSGGGPPVLDDVGLTVAAGEVLGVAGHSGSGKTTAALALLGHLRPGLERRAGTVRVGGIDPFTHPGRVRGRVVSFLGQDPAAALHPYRRIGTQVAEAVRLRGAGGDPADLLRTLGLPADRDFLRRVPGQISGGQARRVALAVALAGDPALLVLDEPTASLDVLLAAAVRDLLAEVAQRCAVLLVSHDPRLLGELAHRAVRLDRGRVVARGTPADVLPAPGVSVAAGVRAPDSEPVLRVDGLCAAHGGTPVLTDLSVRIAAGECVALVGPSGSGKSTLARCVAGLHPAGAGRMELAGRPLGRRRPRGQRAAVALVAQDSAGALNPRETVADALARPLRLLRGLRGPAVAAETGSLLDRVHLPASVAARRPGALSGGERQRVNLARALAAAPVLLLCDEITSALDPETGAAVLGLVDELRRSSGLAVLSVTHDLAVVARTADRVVVLDAGRVVEEGPLGSVLAAPEHPLTRELVRATAELTP